MGLFGRKFKPFGYLPPKQENKIIFYAIITVIALTVMYIASFYLKQ